MSERERLTETLRSPGLVGLDEDEAAELVDAYAHELAEHQRRWALDYDGGEESTYDYTYALTLGANLAADLIDPHAGLVRPGEEPTT